jgi:hydrogenase expression/formation protein HypE
MDKMITLAVGSGGTGTNNFIKDIILENLGNAMLENMGDAAYCNIGGEIAFTTDSYVVRPEFFPGGDIGKISVCGTVNDLAVSGAKPMYLSLGLIIPEGYLVEDLVKVIKSIAKTADEAGVSIVCGDTKVVEKGALDGLIINTAGVGKVVKKLNNFDNLKVGDKVILTSDIARHGMSVMLARGDLGFDGSIESDCAPLVKMFESIYEYDVKFARDATRGGVAAVLNEIKESASCGFLIREDDIVLEENVGYLCEMLGFDPLSVANEGLAVIIVSSSNVDDVIEKIKSDKYGKQACVIGEVTDSNRVILETCIGGKRNVNMPSGELLPRIC